MPIPSASELLNEVQSRPAWDGASISPVDTQFPLVHVDWHEHGFVFQCYEDEESWSDFLVTSRHFSTPSIEVELGGQRWNGGRANYSYLGNSRPRLSITS
jgi:hypothetical protein